MQDLPLTKKILWQCSIKLMQLKQPQPTLAEAVAAAQIKMETSPQKKPFPLLPKKEDRKIYSIVGSGGLSKMGMDSVDKSNNGKFSI